MFNYIYNWWYYNPEVEEEKTFEKQETNEQKYKVLDDIKTFNKSLLKKYKPLNTLQKMKKCKFRKKRKSKRK